MEKERRVKVLSVIALIVAILGLTIAFASLSETLKINGTAEMNPVDWSIQLENIRTQESCHDCQMLNGDGKINAMPTIGDDGLTLSGFSITLSKPGDGVGFIFDIANNGNIDAKLSDVLQNGMSMSKENELCSNVSSDEECDEEVDTYVKQFVHSMIDEADWDGDGITTDEEKLKAINNINWYISMDPSEYVGSGGNTFGINDILQTNKKIRVKFKFVFNSDCDELPKGNIILKNINLKFIFSQS